MCGPPGPPGRVSRGTPRATCSWWGAQAEIGCGSCPHCRSRSSGPRPPSTPGGMRLASPTSSFAGRAISFPPPRPRASTSRPSSPAISPEGCRNVPRRLAALFIFCIIDTLGFGILIPLVPYMADRFGAAPQLITPILGSYSLCQLLAAPLWGRLSDRYGRRPILMSSLAGACLSYLLLGGARNLWWLLASRILAGLMAGNIAAAFAYASDVSAPEKRAATLGLIGAAIGTGFTLGPPLGGMLSGPDPSRADFLAPALVSASLSVLAILRVRFALPESHTAAQRLQPADEPRRGALRLLRERPVLATLAAATLIVTYSQSILESIFAIFALHRYGFGPRMVGLLLFAAALPALLMQGGAVRVLAPRLGGGPPAICGVGT